MLGNPDIGVTQIAHRLGVSPATLYRYIPAARTANTPVFENGAPPPERFSLLDCGPRRSVWLRRRGAQRYAYPGVQDIVWYVCSWTLQAGQSPKQCSEKLPII
jgi:hypothetical protein